MALPLVTVHPAACLPRRLTALLAGLVLSFGLLPAPGFSQAAPQSQKAATAPLKDGVYLYGQAAKANQIGSTYAVMEVQQGQVVGAFYMPSSSFDCFKGKLHQDQLSLTIVNSEDKTAYPYTVALQRNGSTTTAGNAALNPVTLVGFQPLTGLSQVDQRILKVCRTDFSR